MAITYLLRMKPGPGDWLRPLVKCPRHGYHLVCLGELLFNDGDDGSIIATETGFLKLTGEFELPYESENLKKYSKPCREVANQVVELSQRECLGVARRYLAVRAWNGSSREYHYNLHYVVLTEVADGFRVSEQTLTEAEVTKLPKGAWLLESRFSAIFKFIEKAGLIKE